MPTPNFSPSLANGRLRARRTLVAVTLALAALVALAAPRAADAATPSWQCRASVLYVSLAGQSAVEPILANGIKGSAPGATFDKPSCTSDEQGAGDTGAAIPLVSQLAAITALKAKTTITPQTGTTNAQTVTAESTTASIELPIGGALLSVGAVKATATAVCKGGVPDFQGSSVLTDVKLAGVPVTLDQLVNGLGDLLRGLGLDGVLSIDPVNQVVKTGNSIVVTPLRVKVLAAAGTPLADVVIGQTKIAADGDVCGNNGPIDPTDPENQLCPPGSIGQGSKPVVCVIPGTDRYGAIVIGVPNSTDVPRGGTVIPLVEARRLAGLGQLPNSRCLYGPGKDYVVVGTNGADKIYGTRGADRILGLRGNDRLYGVDGNDCLDGNQGNDRISGGEGNDRVYGGAGKDRIVGGGGDDRLYGQDGRDVIYGTQGDDRIDGGSGNDSLFGGSGDDVITTGAGNDSVDAGSAQTRLGDRITTHRSGKAHVSVAIAGPPARVTCRSPRDTVRANRDDVPFLRGCRKVSSTRVVRKGGKAVGVGAG